ncbi:MAG: dihydropteroate synthase [Candidatus Tokpelaia sp. JSC189]|nr:MAG: dihydropteroate synthase [Candidatus Tokpelaia sp. JSC189]
MKRIWQLAHNRTIEVSQKAIIMGILNITPDSFSDGGAYCSVEDAVAAARNMEMQGAHIIDIGGESTRPGAKPVDESTEQARILPVIRALHRQLSICLSVDTYRAETARLAISAGAHIINDIWGLQKWSDIANVAAQTGAGLVIMHTGRGRKPHSDVICDQQQFFKKSLTLSGKAGIKSRQIVLDPGFGFAKTPEENVALMNRAKELQQFGFPLLAGTSRKRFVATFSGKEGIGERDIATSATSVILRMAGFDIFRVHNVAINKEALAIADAVRAVGK